MRTLEWTKFMKRILGDPDRKLVNFHITRGDQSCTTEELCQAVNNAMDQKQNGSTTEDFPNDAKTEPQEISEWSKT
jgi:hypothetical protein